MAAKITELITGSDNVERVRDKIGTILLEEQANQQTLATADAQDPRLWALRIFVEADNPIADFIDCPDQLDGTPIVNVSIHRGDYDKKASSTVDRQKATVVYNLDCYGYGVSATDGGAGHTPGDQKAALEALRAFRLVRRILMAGHYTYLDLRKTVGERWPQDFELFQPPEDQRRVQHVLGVRWRLAVTMNEFSPQVQGEEAEEYSVGVKRKETGELYFTAQYPEP